MRNWKRMRSLNLPLPPECKNFEVYQCGLFAVIKSEDHGRLHMSISHKNRYPTWDEIKEAREHFLPMGKYFVMAFPPPDAFVDFHPNCFHLWECLPERERDLIWTFSQS